MTVDSPPLVTRMRLLLAGSAAAAVLVPSWLLWDNGPPLPRSEAQPVTAFRMIPPEQPIDALAAPLFNAERTPPREGGDAAAPPPIMPTPSVVGLISGRSVPGLALVRASDGQTHLLHIGDAIDGWQLTRISKSNATFSGSGRQEDVALAFGAKSAPPVPLPPGSNAPAAPAGQSTPPPATQPPGR